MLANAKVMNYPQLSDKKIFCAPDPISCLHNSLDYGIRLFIANSTC